jgi:hypothetical protein
MLTETEIVNEVTKVLDRILTENSKSLSEGNFLVRPGFGSGHYLEFYLNSVYGSSGYGIYSLVNYILVETKIYHEILNKVQLGQCLYVRYNQPGDYYTPKIESEEDEKLDEMLYWVCVRCLVFVAHKLVLLGLDVSKYYDGELDGIDYKIEDGLKIR